ncbi:CatA-like O-acetyltransferase [Lapidilactobacillus wuchangensis]|uniref:CatA-like O-acetyltransferase n=1 Tax=Lapidilactobacillus wuchangensis TaxID=2486001 RepID=UPI0013DE5B0C|nr:CatA-like O-acetyltransferase [Lapidilactobacillus wuchangensis]
MAFKQIDLDNWPRQEIFNHFMDLGTTFNLTRRLDITILTEIMKTDQVKLYPALIYTITQTMNDRVNFRLDYNQAGEFGYWEELQPLYTILNPTTKLFSGVVTPLSATYRQFQSAYLADVEQYRQSQQLFPQGVAPTNIVNISMIPWTDFSAFSLQNAHEPNYLRPIVTIGQFEKSAGRVLLPVALQAHHAVIDGYDAAWFFNQLQIRLTNFLTELSK